MYTGNCIDIYRPFVFLSSPVLTGGEPSLEQQNRLLSRHRDMCICMYMDMFGHLTVRMSACMHLCAHATTHAYAQTDVHAHAHFGRHISFCHIGAAQLGSNVRRQLFFEGVNLNLVCYQD